MHSGNLKFPSQHSNWTNNNIKTEHKQQSGQNSGEQDVKEKRDSEHYHVITAVRAPETQCSHHSESKGAKKTLEIKDRQRKSKKKSGEPEEKNQNSEHWAPKEQPTLKRLNTSNKRVPENQISHHSASRNKTYKTKDRQRKSKKYGEQEGRKTFRTLSRYLHYELITLKRLNTQQE